MKIVFFISCALLLNLTIPLCGNGTPVRPRISSFPYISGDTFQLYADFVLDDEHTFNPTEAQNGSVIFVKTEYLKTFFNRYEPKIQYPYILITHNSDEEISEKYKPYLNDQKIIIWFTLNANYTHPKLIPLPIGLVNRHSPCGDISIIDDLQNRIKQNEFTKNKLLYVNFTVGTCPQIRKAILEKLIQKPFCFRSDPKPFKDYLIDLAESYFVASPRGTGIDCHRTWEAILMGSIPIVESSQLDIILKDLPVLIIKDWSCITEEYLKEQYEIINSKKYNFEKIFVQYWFDLIDSYKPHE